MQTRTRMFRLSRLSACMVAMAAVACLGAVAVAAPAAANPGVGAPALAFTATNADGMQRSLDEYAGKVIVLEWTNHDCPYVRKHYGSGNMQALQKQATADGVVWLTIISSAPGEQGYVSGAEAKTIAAKTGAAPSDILLDPDGTVGRAYGAKTTPHMYVIDGAGRLVYMGGIDDRATTDPADIKDADNYVAAALADVAADRAVATPTAQPYGCSVKYKR